jgi:hypothetical protein
MVCPDGHEFRYKRPNGIIVGTLNEAMAYRQRVMNSPHHSRCSVCDRFFPSTEFGVGLEQLKDK